jgi:hypothetical protein
MRSDVPAFRHPEHLLAELPSWLIVHESRYQSEHSELSTCSFQTARDCPAQSVHVAAVSKVQLPKQMTAHSGRI